MGEFSQYMCNEGIQPDVTPHYTHWMNGEVERVICTLQEHILAMLVTTQLPLTYWSEAALTACYLLNITVITSNGVTPFKLMHKRKPNLQHLQVWGLRCFVHVPEE